MEQVFKNVMNCFSIFTSSAVVFRSGKPRREKLLVASKAPNTWFDKLKELLTSRNGNWEKLLGLIENRGKVTMKSQKEVINSLDAPPTSPSKNSQTPMHNTRKATRELTPFASSVRA